jgi:hypothetical protein
LENGGTVTPVDDDLFTDGPFDVVDPDDPDGKEGRRGGKLHRPRCLCSLPPFFLTEKEAK